MSLFVIADLHLDTKSNKKSMEFFGNRWNGYVSKIQKNWNNLVGSNDTVVLPGDISWALTMEQALDDLRWIDALPGQKILLKGNHDFWWSTASKMNRFFCENRISTIDILNNTAIETENFIISGSRGWFTDKTMQTASQNVDYKKIINREVIRLKMSLDHAKQLQKTSEKEILTFLHFPPLWSDFQCDEILELLSEYDIKRCFFGHIHGCYTVPATFAHESTTFQMISADFLDFIPQIIL